MTSPEAPAGTTAESDAARPPLWGIGTAALGAVLAVLLIWAFPPFVRAVSLPYHAQVVVAWLVVWVPLTAVALWATFARGSGSLVRDFGLRFRWIDLIWGLAVGLIMRAVASLIEIGVYGQPLGRMVFGETVHDGWWVFGALLAPILIGPFIEEVYFRGLMQRAVARVSGSPWLAVGVTAVVFGLLHIADATSWQSALVLGLSTALFGAAAGVLAVLTGRIGGAIIAHVAFNGLLVVLVGA